jgi:hypothetical protein
MQYWRLRVAACKGGEYDVFYKSPINLLQINVARNAVIDGDLHAAFMSDVDTVEEISAEKYYENMYD